VGFIIGKNPHQLLHQTSHQTSSMNIQMLVRYKSDLYLFISVSIKFSFEKKKQFSFFSLGEIDTLNEKYQADIYFEARWIEKRMNLNPLNLTTQQQTQLYENSVVKMTELNTAIQWSPQLFIENAVAQIGEQDKWFTIKKADSELTQPSSPLFVHVEICEHRRMKGIFWEKLELNHVSILLVRIDSFENRF
jgi:hypothetical protein